MNDQMKIRDLNFKVTCLQNGLRIEKGQANVAYKENQDLKREVDSLKVKLQNANEDKLATISAERKRWAREDLLAIKIGNLEHQAKGIEDAVNKLEQPDVPGAPVLIINYDLLEFAGLLRNQAKALKDQGND